MSWISLSFEIDAAHVHTLVEALQDQGALSVDVTDADAGTASETPLFCEAGEVEQALWPRNRIAALFHAGFDGTRALEVACEAAGVPAPNCVETEAIGDQDWVRATQQQFSPIEISPRLWIVPSWCQPPIPDALVLKLDPGLAFGTGSHPTTWQCLRWLDEHLRPGESLLDYGSGSGILAIAAKKLGAERVIGTDIDPNALVAGRGNARDNAVDVEFVAPDALPDKRFDVVVANILANPLRVLAPLLSERTRPGGNIVLAGILESQVRAVSDAYSSWIDLAVSGPREGWVCLAGTRKR